MEANVLVDTKEINRLERDIIAAKHAMIGQLADRGRELLTEEAPKRTGNLKKGVAAPDVDYPNLTATLNVSATQDSYGAGVAEVYGADGKKRKSVTLRPRPAYNYAEVVARGNKQATLTPKTAKAFLIPVPTAPDDEGYLIVNGQTYVVRRSRKAQKANPFDWRAADRLEKEAPTIGEAVLREFV